MIFFCSQKLNNDSCVFVTKHSDVTALTSNNSVVLPSQSHQLSRFYETRKLVAVFTIALLSVPLHVLLPYFFKVILIYLICCISIWNSALSQKVSANAGFLDDKAAVLGPVT
jgi:hypothetical protein